MMSHTPTPPETLFDTDTTAQDNEAWVKDGRGLVRVKRHLSTARREEIANEVQEFLGSGDWTFAKPSHLVALYAWCHEEVYGVPPGELASGPAYTRATYLAARFLRDEFSGELIAAVECIRWIWSREQGREKWRRENNQPGRRLDPRLAFSAALVTDYRLELARKAKTNG